MSVNNLLDSGNPAESWKALRLASLVVDNDIGSDVSLPSVTTEYILGSVTEKTFNSSLNYLQFGQFIYVSLSSPSNSCNVAFDTIKIYTTRSPPAIEQNISILVSIDGIIYNAAAIISTSGNITVYPPTDKTAFPSGQFPDSVAIFLPYQTINYIL